MKSEPSLLVKFSDLNAEKHYINLANGTLDLRKLCVKLLTKAVDLLTSLQVKDGQAAE